MRKIVVVVVALALMLGACNEDKAPKDSASERSQKISETYQKRLETAVPYPLEAMKDSVERRGLRERLLRFNQANKIGYVYLLSNTGSVIGFYTISGKVSSTQSQLTASEIERVHGQSGNQSGNSIEAPGDDGSYGPNEEGMFAFTTEGVMVQWNTAYIYSDAPLKVTSAPLLVLEAGSKPSSTAEAPAK